MKFYQKWQGRSVNRGSWFIANVPGNIQYDYAKANSFKDMQYGCNFKQFNEIEDDTFEYKTVLDFTANENERVFILDPTTNLIEALNAFQAKQEEERLKAENERRLKYKDEINSSANAPFVGPEEAKVTVVEFFDFSCGYCKRIAPAIEKVIADNTDVKFVFKPLSFVSPVSASI